jgi:hypothetical protein
MFFSRAALEWLLVSGKQPDCIHLHDWQSAAVVSCAGGGREAAGGGAAASLCVPRPVERRATLGTSR